MNWKALGPLLGVILLAALAFAFWPEVPVRPPPPAPAAEPLPTEDPPPPPQLKIMKPMAQLQPQPQPIGPALIADRDVPVDPDEKPKLDPVIDPDRLRELGVPESAIEPEDAGVLHKLDRAGMRQLISENFRQVDDCYRQWQQSDPKLGKVRLELQIVEIPGRARGKVQSVVVTDGGAGHDAFERCIGNLFKETRFEPPKAGETRVIYPLPYPSYPSPGGRDTL